MATDDETDWEEVDVAGAQHIEITLSARSKQGASRKHSEAYAKRRTRINCHKIHTVCLLANASARNYWINDPLLHARLLSLTPLELQNAFSVIHKSRVPDQNQRGRLFEAAINRLTEWWTHSFFQVDSSGHIRNATFDDVQAQIAGLESEEVPRGIQNDEDEVIRSSKSLMKHALMQAGTRDTSAQLFTALCRALGIPARLVVSLQGVPWQAGIGKPKPIITRKWAAGNGKGKEKMVEEETSDEDGGGHASERSFPGHGMRLDGGVSPSKGKGKAEPVITLRKTRSKGHKLSSSVPRPQRPSNPSTTPPVFWTEVFSRPDARWFPVDPIRNVVNKRKVFDPSISTTAGSSSSNSPLQDNRMVYVIAFEEDGYARDVTPRYAIEYGAKVAKAQEAGGKVGGTGKGRKQWWEGVTGIVRRPFRLLRDDMEDSELQANQLKEGMPTAMAGFKDHPLYVLARHLRRDEVIHPLTELGKFRGEPVYPRSNVIALKTAETWMRNCGRIIKPGCQPMKWVKMRPVTLGRKRELELAVETRKEARKEDNGQNAEAMQGMYAENQTELFIPEPIIDGKIPQNSFGNIDLFVPSMLPRGAAHVPYKGAAKIARKLGFSHAEPVVGFEFRKRRATPIIQGVVIAAENEQILLDAYWEAEREAEERARTKRHDRVIKQWTRLVQGLRLRKRLQEQYAEKPISSLQVDQSNGSEETHNALADDISFAGGYLTAADDIVQPFHLPKAQYPVVNPSSSAPADKGHPEEEEEARLPKVLLYNFEALDDHHDMPFDEHQYPPRVSSIGVPKTMREMAEEAARFQVGDQAAELVAVESGKGHSFPSLRTQTHGKDTRSTPILEGKATLRSTRASGAKKRKRDEDITSSGDGQKASSRNRGRGGKVEGTPPPTPTTRVLRPRIPKSTAQIAEEEARERAYRTAITE